MTDHLFKTLCRAALLVLAAAMVSTALPENANTIVARVNGEPVQLNEFMLIANQKKSLVYDYFKQKHGVDAGKNFWKEKFGNESPLAKLKEMTLRDLVKIKIEQIMAKKHGIASDIRYSSFLKDWEKENARRKAAVARNEAIYGPVQYSEQDYFNYVHSNRVIRLKEELTDLKFMQAIREQVNKAIVEISDSIINQVILN